MLFKPQWGMGLHTLKVEIGGDTNSGDGSEPSHSHARGDLSCTRGYELWLLREAKARNSLIKTYGLSWGAPSYINNGTFFGPEMWTYQVSWLACVRSELGFDIDYIGVYNERDWGGVDYIIGLRATLDAAGFNHTQIIIPDGLYDASIMAAAASDAAFNASFDGIGLHYPCRAKNPVVQESGKKYWASEDWWDQPDWEGAATWGHLLNQNYIENNMTATIAWSPLWAVYSPQLIFEEAGMLRAREPWSAHWDVSLPVWTASQWSQFTAPGWRFLSVVSGSSGLLPGGGTYVSLVPDGGAAAGFTLIIETFVAPKRCAGVTPPRAQQTLTFVLTHGLPAPGTHLFVWQTTETAPFVALPDLVVDAQGAVTVTVPVDAMLTLTTVAGGQKGTPSAPVPPSAPFPLPFTEDFSGYAEDAMARFFADQYGSFAVRNATLVQVAPANPAGNRWWYDADPLTVLGDAGWADVALSVLVTFPPLSSSSSQAIAASDGESAVVLQCDIAAASQSWALGKGAMEGYLINGEVEHECLAVYGCGTRAVLWSCVTSGGTCAGPKSYANLQWQLTTGGALISALSAESCLQASLPFGTLSIGACTPGAVNQTWAYDSVTLRLGATGLCLARSTPPLPPHGPVYAQVCGRITELDSTHSPPSISGYCCRIQESSGAWALTRGVGGVALVNGTVATPLPLAFALRITLNGTLVDCAVGGLHVGGVTDALSAGGLGAVGSSYDAVAFGAFSAVPVY